MSIKMVNSKERLVPKGLSVASNPIGNGEASYIFRIMMDREQMKGVSTEDISNLEALNKETWSGKVSVRKEKSPKAHLEVSVQRYNSIYNDEVILKVNETAERICGKLGLTYRSPHLVRRDVKTSVQEGGARPRGGDSMLEFQRELRTYEREELL